MSNYGSMRRPVARASAKKHLASVQKSFLRGVIFLFIATLLIIFVFGDHGLFQLYKLKKERAEIQLYITQLRKNREILYNEKNKLENDLKYIEKLAREKYRMAKPGEKVFKVVPKDENSKK
jgi:cell division protein FtsB